MKSLAFAIVISFGAGFAVGVTVYDAKANSAQCERAKENAKRFAAALAEVLNGGLIETNDVTANCRIKRRET